MKKIIVQENQKGFLFQNGRFKKLIGPGKYYLFGDREIETVSGNHAVQSKQCPLSTLLEKKEIQALTETVEVGDETIVLHFENGKFCGVLPTGKYAFWKDDKEHTFQSIDIREPEVGEDIPKYLFSKIPTLYYTKVEVAAYQKARLYYDRKLVRLLEPGTYYFWKNATQIDVGFQDTRLMQMNITGQEILTLDKVSLRMNLVVHYKVTDCIKIHTEIDDFEEQIHVCAQLALRAYVGKHKVDEILEKKEEISAFVYEKLKEKESSFFVKISDAGVKDIILPGEIREIMNTVLIAEKKAQANVITRREEVASTRSLLNTAKLMDENKTLYKLKELEYLERICDNVGQIHLSGNSQILGQLSALIRGEA